jgi:hypothetical protein
LTGNPVYRGEYQRKKMPRISKNGIFGQALYKQLIFSDPIIQKQSRYKHNGKIAEIMKVFLDNKYKW